MAETTCSKQGNNQRVQDDPKHTLNSSSLSDRSSDDPSAGWKESSLHRSKNNESLNPRINADNDQKKTVNDYTGQTNFLKMQSAMVAQDALIRAGYDMQSFYGWLPGFAPVRFPAFIYPPSFFGFAPNVALEKDSSICRNTAADQRKDGNKDETPILNEEVQDTSESVESEQQNEEHELSSVKDYSTDALVKDIRSDEDEGFGREETDLEKAPNSLKRGRSLEEDEHFQPQRRVVSVIQENSSFQKPMEDSQDDTVSQCSNYKLTKRGRASTRQIEKTDQYWDRRKKNNVSAKKSRDARRQREIITNQRSSMLETENLRLRAEVATLRDENERMKKEMSKIM